MWDLAKKGDIEEISAKQRIRFFGTFQKISEEYKVRPKDLAEPCGIWLFGKAGVGKSHAARHQFGGPVHVQPINKWWSHYQDEPVAVIDDFAPCHAREFGDYLKIWADQYPFNGERKGGHTGPIRPKRIIVTSQYSLSECFKDLRTRDALSRRFRQYELIGKWNEGGSPRANALRAFVASLPPLQDGDGVHVLPNNEGSPHGHAGGEHGMQPQPQSAVVESEDEDEDVVVIEED